MESVTELAIGLLRVIHVITAVLLAWPFYALVAVNQRARLGPPLGDRADTYLENTIKSRVVPCYVFQTTALVTGLALVALRGLGVQAFFDNPALGLKFVLLLVLAGLLTYVTLWIQPRIDELFRSLASGTAAAETAPAIARLRLRRKRIASTCLFVVLTIVILGVQVWAPFPSWLNGLLVLSAAFFSWRSYASQVRLGWL